MLIDAGANVDPKPRMKGVDAKLPTGSAFDGHVQAMAESAPTVPCGIDSWW